ncbi:MAG: LysR family transcriptional regulator [Actinomycetota bacterium]
MDRLSALRAFLTVGDAGSFSAAARVLGVSTSMVSRLVSGLEADLGVRLMQRTTRTVTLTEAGHGYADRCRRILADLEEADLQVSRLQSEPVGRLRISAPMSFGVAHLAPVLPDFFRRHQRIALDLSMTDRFVDLVEEGLDLAVRIGPMTDSSLVARRLCPIRMAVVASPAYLAERGVPQSPADLAAHDCIASRQTAAGWTFADGSVVAPGSRFAVDNGDVVRVMALAGCGLVYLPTFFVGKDIRDGALVRVLDAYVASPSVLHAVYPHARHLSPKVRAFVDYLASRFGPEPYWDEGL